MTKRNRLIAYIFLILLIAGVLIYIVLDGSISASRLQAGKVDVQTFTRQLTEVSDANKNNENRISDVKRALGLTISENEKTLFSKITSLETSLSQRIAKVEINVKDNDQDLRKLIEKLATSDTRQDKVLTVLNKEIDDLRAINTNLQKQITELKSQIEMMDRRQSLVEKNIKATDVSAGKAR